ncbi:protein of unknown function [Rhodococcus sp. RD6.2]|nr:protein of unknown function [Rhodococcus sp. RD6.2]
MGVDPVRPRVVSAGQRLLVVLDVNFHPDHPGQRSLGGSVRRLSRRELKGKSPMCQRFSHDVRPPRRTAVLALASGRGWLVVNHLDRRLP